MEIVKSGLIRMPWEIQRESNPSLCFIPKKCYGIALGHGHAYGNDFMKQFPEIPYWYMVDADTNAYPDYVCRVDDPIAMDSPRESNWDIIVSVCCPIFWSRDMFCSVLQIVKKLLKPDGVFYLQHRFWTSFLRLISKEERSLIENEIFFLLGWENIQKFMCMDENYHSNPFDNIACGNYGYRGLPQSKEVNEMVEAKAMPVIEKILSENGFTLLKASRDNYSILIPIS